MLGALPHIHGNPIAHVLHADIYKQSVVPKLLITFRPGIATMRVTQSYRTSIQADMETYLKQAIPIREPLQVFEPANHMAFAAPPNTAPALCIAACELVGGQRSEAMAAASALHLVHAASFSHEHLSLTDKPESESEFLRHVEVKYGPNIRLLTGDGIFPFGLELLARTSDPAQANSEQILRVIIEITRAAGSQGTIKGRYLKEARTQSNGEEVTHVERIKDMVRKLEGELHACGAACGAILGGGNEDDIEKLRKYGLYVGMIQGMLQVNVGRNDERLMEEIQVFRSLAWKELEGFNGSKVEEISAFVNSNL